MRVKLLILTAAFAMAGAISPAAGPFAKSEPSRGPALHAGLDAMPGSGDAELRPPFTIAHRAMAASARDDSAAYYILELADAPVARYHGEIDELAPTSPRATGRRKLDTQSPATLAYVDYLERRQNEAIAAIERALGRTVEVLHRYQFAFNGLAVWLAPEEAQKVAALDGVRRVERNVVEGLLTDVGPRLIGAPSIWDGSATGGLPGTKGEGVVVGVIDTGINMDHPSFAATGGDGFTHTNPLGAGKYVGWCDPANPNYDVKYVCNAKLIGAWSYPDSSMNPEDEDSHGSHTSSTAAGNILKLAVPTITLDREVSGVAPHANIIMYDACAGAGCNSTATVAAIEQATKDGVDALNYSIAIGRNSPWVNSRLVAFMGAYEAGVFVAASAGNAGQPGTVNATAPWITSVAALTHGRSFSNALINMSGGGSAPGDMDAAGFTAGYGPAKIVYAKGYNNVGGMADDGMCNMAFPAGTWNGEIVVCDRGGQPRVVKGQNVKAGGAGGFVLANTPAQGDATIPDPHYLPGVNIGAANAQALKTWLASGADHMAQIKGVTVNEDPAQTDNMADFSSRGPAFTSICCRRPGNDPDLTYFDVLKPDIGGPGVDIIAAVASGEFTVSPEFGLLSGTSMSSPHLAGSGALMSAVHPDWTPPQIQSAMMLTAKLDGIRKEDGSSPVDFFDTGSGRVDLTRAARTGLVLDETPAAFAAADPDKGGMPSSLNLASMADTFSFGTSRWNRTLKSTRDAPTAWTVEVAPAPGQTALPAGLSVTVSPMSFTIPAKGTQTIAVTADTTGLPIGSWASAQIVLKAEGGAAPEAHMPIVVRRADRKLPPAVVIYTDQTMGSKAVTGLRAPAITALTIEPFGLVKGDAGTTAIAVDPTNTNPFDNPAGTFVFTRTIEADSKRLVVEVTGSSATDIDLYVGRDLNGDGQAQPNELACTSGRELWDELCDMSGMPPGVYWILLQNFDGNAGQPDSVSYVSAVVPGASATNMQVTGPASVPAAEPFDLAVNWRLPTLGPGDRWYGAFNLGTSAAGAGDLGTIVVDLISTIAVSTPTPSSVPPTVTRTPVPPTTVVPPTTSVPPTATRTPVAPTATSPAPNICVCTAVLGGRVPQAVIDRAVANPTGVNGWQQPLNPNRPVSPGNPLRMCLSLQNPNQSFHPMFNSLVFRVGCP